MDLEQEKLETLGFFGISKEAIKIVLTWRKIFFQITLALILPLSMASLAHMIISLLLLCNNSYSKLIILWLIKTVVFALVIALFFISTAVVAYCVTSIYSDQRGHLTFTEVMSIIPKARKRLMVTFIWSFGAILAYNCLLVFLFLVIFTTFYSSSDNGLVLGLVFYGLYLVGLFYMGVNWQLTIPVLVLEDENYGVHAMKKSKELLKGKMGTAIAIVVTGAIWGGAAGFLFARFVMFDQSIGVVAKVGFALVSLLLLILLFLLGLVMQSVFYFVDKSYHHESIDYDSVLQHPSASHIGEYAPLASTNTPLGGRPSLA